MPHVTVNIGGRPYRLACGEGEEAHLELLAQMVEEKIEGFRGSFGEIGDQRMAVMAAITLADELLEAERRIASQREELDMLRQLEQQHESASEGWVAAIAESLDEVAERIESAASALNNAPKMIV